MNAPWMLAACLLAAPLPPLAEAPQPARSFVVDDFEDGDRVAAPGLSWITISDAVMGGSSVVRLEVAGAKGKRALRATGTIAKDGFGGVWVALDPEARAVDLSAFRSVRLRLRGKGEWLVGLRAGAGPGNNYMSRVDGAEGWRTAEVPLADLRARSAPGREAAPFDAREVRWLGVSTAPGRSGDFTLEIDDVELVGASAVSSPHGPRMQKRIALTPLRALDGARWQPLGTDASGDGKTPGLPDAVSLSWWASGGVVWFRIGLSSPPGSAFGTNLVLDVDGDPSNGQPWWGTNTGFRFDRLVTAWVLDTVDGMVDGTLGITSADDAMKGSMMDPSLGDVRLAVDGKDVFVGVPRAALGTSGNVRVVAAAGSAMRHNDDLPDEGGLSLRLGR